MEKAILKNYIVYKQTMGTGAFDDPPDSRDYPYDAMALGAPAVDWNKGFHILNHIEDEIPFKNQDGSSSCVGQAYSYYGGVKNAIEVGYYDETSAKSIYSYIALNGGGAYLREGAKRFVDYGANLELLVPSYENGNPPSERFMTDKSWLTPEIESLAKILQASEYRRIVAAKNMDLFATAIRDNHGVVAGVRGSNNGTWGTYEPKPPTNPEWGHALYFGAFGIDDNGKYIATPNSWGARKKTKNYPDGWQKLREDYFTTGNMFDPWTLTDKPNPPVMSEKTKELMEKMEKKIIIEGTGIGRQGIIIGGKLRDIKSARAAKACLYALANNKLGITIDTKTFEEMVKGADF